MKIDAHTHILPENWPDLRSRYGYGGFVRLEHHKPCCARMMIDDKFFREIESNSWDPVVRMAECNNHGVDVQVISTVPVMFSYWAKPEHTLDLSMILNDHIVDVVDRHPSRFIGLGTLPMQSPDLAVKELERITKLDAFAGIQIGTHVNAWNLEQPQIFEVLSACAELGAAVFVHPWDMMGTDVMRKYWLPWLVGMPAETSRAICSVIFGGVLERLPNLKICFAHGGGSFPGTVGRIGHGFEVRPDLCAIDNPVHPRDYLGKFYVDTLVHDPIMLEYLIRLMGADKIMIGSDYPFPLGEEVPGSLIEQVRATIHEKEQMRWRSAVDWLSLNDNQMSAIGLKHQTPIVKLA